MFSSLRPWPADLSHHTGTGLEQSMNLGNVPNLQVSVLYQNWLQLSQYETFWVSPEHLDRAVVWLVTNWLWKLSFRWYLKGCHLIRSTGDQSENCFFYPFSSELWVEQQLWLLRWKCWVEVNQTMLLSKTELDFILSLTQWNYLFDPIPQFSIYQWSKTSLCLKLSK